MTQKIYFVDQLFGWILNPQTLWRQQRPFSHGNQPKDSKLAIRNHMNDFSRTVDRKWSPYVLCKMLSKDVKNFWVMAKKYAYIWASTSNLTHNIAKYQSIFEIWALRFLGLNQGSAMIINSAKLILHCFWRLKRKNIKKWRSLVY